MGHGPWHGPWHGTRPSARGGWAGRGREGEGERRETPCPPLAGSSRGPRQGFGTLGGKEGREHPGWGWRSSSLLPRWESHPPMLAAPLLPCGSRSHAPRRRRSGGESARAQFCSARPLETANAVRFPTRRVGGKPGICKPPDGLPGPRGTTISRAWESDGSEMRCPWARGTAYFFFFNQNSPPRFESAEEEVGPRSGGTEKLPLLRAPGRRGRDGSNSPLVNQAESGGLIRHAPPRCEVPGVPGLR